LTQLDLDNTRSKATTNHTISTIGGEAQSTLMSGHPQVDTVKAATGAAFAWRVAAFYAALFGVLGVQVPFLPVWLAAKGLDAGAIGVVLAVPMVVRVAAIPLATHGADRRDALHAALLIAAGVSALGYGALALVSGFAAIIVAYAFTSAFCTPIMPLAEAYALRGLASHGRAYGPVRLWGSAAFIAGTLGAGLALDVMPARDLIWLLVAAMMATASAAGALAPLKPRTAPTADKAASAAGALLRQPVLLAGVAAASLVQASHAVYYGFSALDWKAAGFDGGSIGALWSVGVLAEIALFAVSPRLATAPTALLALGAFGGVLRWGAMALDPPALALVPLQCLHALSFGATHLGSMGLLTRAVPGELGATAQGYFAVVLGLVMAVAMGASGALYARWGTLVYAAMALTAGAGGLFALAAHRFARTNYSQV
jgi:PPP family 3-phenylpropionic acid transporter